MSDEYSLKPGILLIVHWYDSGLDSQESNKWNWQDEFLITNTDGLDTEREGKLAISESS